MLRATASSTLVGTREKGRPRTTEGTFDPSEFGPLPPENLPIPFPEKILDLIGKGVQGADRKLMLSKATSWPRRYASEPVTLSQKFDSVKSAYMFCTRGADAEYLDDILKGKWGKLEGPHKVIESEHYPMITKPAELARAMLELA